MDLFKIIKNKKIWKKVKKKKRVRCLIMEVPINFVTPIKLLATEIQQRLQIWKDWTWYEINWEYITVYRIINININFSRMLRLIFALTILSCSLIFYLISTNIHLHSMIVISIYLSNLLFLSININAWVHSPVKLNLIWNRHMVSMFFYKWTSHCLFTLFPWRWCINHFLAF